LDVTNKLQLHLAFGLMATINKRAARCDIDVSIFKRLRSQ